METGTPDHGRISLSADAVPHVPQPLPTDSRPALASVALGLWALAELRSPEPLAPKASPDQAISAPHSGSVDFEVEKTLRLALQHGRICIHNGYGTLLAGSAVGDHPYVH